MTITWCMVPEIWSVTDKIFCHFWPIFAPIPPMNPENQNFENMKIIPGDIIILHMCTINDNHMMYGSWDMKRDKQNFLSFWTLFCPFTPLTTQKIKILKNWKKHMKILSFYTCMAYMTIIWCMVPEIRSMADRICCHFGLFFTLIPPYGPRKSKFWKHENNIWRYYEFTHAYHQWQSYDVWFLRYEAWQTKFFVILDHFSPFYPSNTLKIKCLKNEKTPGYIIILQ